jgi:dTDP-4-dehydrorhamnose reductase
MRALITGGAGLLGQTLIGTAPAAWEVHATQRRTPVRGATPHPAELSDVAAVEALLARLRPQLVIHTAYSMQQGERDVWQATQAVVAACRAIEARLIYLSTDALLDGEHAPYAEDAAASPVHEYGRWKARSEAHVRDAMPEAAVIRTSLITRFEPPDPRCAWVAGALRRGEPITLFADEIRCPIDAGDLARQIWEIALLSAPHQAGVWNLAGPEALSRYTLGVLIAAQQRLDPGGLTAALSASSPTPRPRDLRLSTARADRMLATRARPISSLLAPPPTGDAAPEPLTS